ncbi:MAG: hypothetical protein O2V44_02550 [Candidatus Bathyarchaeota archaeon]|nr:hypothetical protein [Candidatus Bathyarchaeota archaeon]
METKGNSYSTLTEKELFELLAHVLSGTSEDHKHKRINGLEELQRRIKSNSIQNMNGSIDILLEMAKKHGQSRPESSLIVDSLLLLIGRCEEAFQTVLNGLKAQDQEEDLLFLVFSNLALKVDYKLKRRAIKPLVNYLMSRDALNRTGANEVYNCLLSLGDWKLSTDIVKETSPYLERLETCAIVFSAKLCSRFADRRLLPKMLQVLEKSMAGYYNAHHIEIERRLCEYFKRTKDPRCFPHLLRLLKLRYREYPVDKSDAIGEILDANPYLKEYILEMLHDTRHNKELVTAILHSFENMEKPPSAMTLLPKLRIRYWWERPASYYVRKILVKGGESSKPILFEMLQDDEKYDYALECLKEIGVSTEELSNVFPKPPILQIYNFLYSQARRVKKMPKDLNTLWMEKEGLGENVPGTTDRLEHLLLHVFSCFNFVTLNVAPLHIESVDIIGFHPETLDLLIIGCTTGVLKDDLAKMDALVNKMEKEMPDLFSACTVTPVVVCSKSAAISPSDAKYSREQEIAILQDYDIDKLLEMLNTNREPRQVLGYIEDCKWKYEDTSVAY